MTLSGPLGSDFSAIIRNVLVSSPGFMTLGNCRMGWGSKLSMAPAAHPSSHSPNSDQPQWARASDLSSLLGSLWSGSQARSKSIQRWSSIKISLHSYPISLFPSLVFILGKHNAFSYPETTMSHLNLKTFFSPGHTCFKLIAKDLLICSTVETRSKFRIVNSQVILNHINDKHWYPRSPLRKPGQ